MPIDTPHSLANHYRRRWTQLSRQVDQAIAHSHLRKWFRHELAVLNLAPSHNVTLEAIHARLMALTQLQRLVNEHLSADEATATGKRSESFLTHQARLPAHVLSSTLATNFSIDPKLIHDESLETTPADAVSDTAKIVSLFRSSDPALSLPAWETFNEDGVNLLRETGGLTISTRAKLGLLFASRHHAIDNILARQGANQTLELAAGISPRGLLTASQHQNTLYVESDLPHLMRAKAKILRDTINAGTCTLAGVLHCRSSDAFDISQMQEALEPLDTHQPISIVTEGLLLYFSINEMRCFWGNMQRILNAHPLATWTTDIVTLADMHQLLHSDREVATVVRHVFEKTGRRVISHNPFETDDDVTAWAERHSLRVRRTRLLSRATHPHTGRFLSSGQTGVLGNRKAWCFQSAAAR